MSSVRSIPELCRRQARWCEKLGSPLYTYLLNNAADDFEHGGPIRDLLRGHEQDPPGSALPLRMMGAVHRIVLEGSAPRLAQFYPSVGGEVVLDAAWSAFRSTISQNLDMLRDLVRCPVQTNEIGRAGALLGGFLLIANRTRLPLRLFEIGASAGLNLRWDKFRYTWTGGAWGDPASPVVISDVFVSEAKPRLTEVSVVERSGCDPNPIDPISSDGDLTLRSYIWADQVQRIRQLMAAVQVSRAYPCTVERAGAAEWLRQHLLPVSGRATVLFQSIVWQYMSELERRETVEVLEEAGRRTSPDAPLAWLRLESGKGTAEVRLRIFPGLEDQMIATAGYHAPAVNWLLG